MIPTHFAHAGHKMYVLDEIPDPSEIEGYEIEPLDRMLDVFERELNPLSFINFWSLKRHPLVPQGSVTDETFIDIQSYMIEPFLTPRYWGIAD